MTMRILVIDNYDSFVYNLVQYLGQLEADVIVRRNDALSDRELDDVRMGTVDGAPIHGVLLSPGPGTPYDSGACLELLRRVVAAGSSAVPILGVCLGHQALAVAVGATVHQAPELLHGKTSQVFHDGAGVLAGLPNPFTATRYHSLIVDESTVPSSVEVTGHAESGVLMAMRHRSLPIEGVQFHPESVLTQAGHLLLANWLATCGDEKAVARAADLVAQTEERRLKAFAV